MELHLQLVLHRPDPGAGSWGQGAIFLLLDSGKSLNHRPGRIEMRLGARLEDPNSTLDSGARIEQDLGTTSRQLGLREGAETLEGMQD